VDELRWFGPPVPVKKADLFESLASELFEQRVPDLGMAGGCPSGRNGG